MLVGNRIGDAEVDKHGGLTQELLIPPIPIGLGCTNPGARPVRARFATPRSPGQLISSTTTIPQIVSNVLLTA